MNIFEPMEAESNSVPISISHQKILFGVQGTGKHAKIIQEYVGNSNYFDVIFHTGTTHDSFIGETDYKITHQKILPKSFAKAYKTAWEQLESSCFIVIQDINRGNCSEIFGDLIPSLARNDKGYSKIPVEARTNFGKWLTEEFSQNPKIKALFESVSSSYEGIEAFDYSQIILPPNLYIYATMNTDDDIISTMDNSFKRVWDWEYCAIDYYEANYTVIELSNELQYCWGSFIKKINKRILEITGSERKLIGHHFVNPVDKVISLELFKSKVISYLWIEFFANEYNNPLNIFLYQQVGGSHDVLPFTLSDLFETSTDKWLSDVYLISSFLNILGVKKL